MAITLFDSTLYHDLLGDDAMAALFGDHAELRSMLRVEGALARVQGALGVIPRASGDAIADAAANWRPDPADLGTQTGRDGLPVPALVAGLRQALDSPTHAQYAHWGATSQDIIDTGLVLRLRDVCDLLQRRITLLLEALATLAQEHDRLPLAARTRGQIAIPTSFGAVVAAWGNPLLTHLEVLAQLRPRLLRVSLAGAAGNSTVLADRAADVRCALAAELGLADAETPWHSDRSALAEFCAWMTRVIGSLAKMAEDIVGATQSEVGEIRLAHIGGSSTMPHKQNPVAAETLISLFQLAQALDGAMQRALPHRQQRDGAAWMLEWHALPQSCRATGSALQLALGLAQGIEADGARMRANLEASAGLIYAEAISYRLSEDMSRPDAQSSVKTLCRRSTAEGRSLGELVTEAYPQVDWRSIMQPEAQLGDAPAQARSFARRVHALR